MLERIAYMISYARVRPTSSGAEALPALPDAAPQASVRAAVRFVKTKAGKRSLADIGLQQTGVLNVKLRRLLQAQGIRSAAAFVAMPCEQLEPHCSAARVKRLQHAIRMAHSLEAMRPWHALLLFAIHRRSPNKLANESAGVLYRDITRFAWSSHGLRLLAGHPKPSLERVEKWIDSARQRRQRRSLAAGQRRAA